jgi:hypothetical protein
MIRNLQHFFKVSAGTVLFPSFLSLLLVYYYLSHLDFSLSDFPGEMIGTATIHGIDVGKRVNTLYITVLIALTSFFTVNGVMQVLSVPFQDRLPDP